MRNSVVRRASVGEADADHMSDACSAHGFSCARLLLLPPP
jgi:hypothetical protein